jgi:hypothetical protein
LVRGLKDTGSTDFLEKDIETFGEHPAASVLPV